MNRLSVGTGHGFGVREGIFEWQLLSRKTVSAKDRSQLSECHIWRTAECSVFPVCSTMKRYSTGYICRGSQAPQQMVISGKVIS